MDATWLLVLFGLPVLAFEGESPVAPVPGEIEPGVPAPNKIQKEESLQRAQASVDVRSQMGKHFRFVEATIFVDGNEVYHRAAKTDETLHDAFRAYDGALSSGPHEVAVTLVYVGRNVGPFSYLDDYHYRLTASSRFEVADINRPAAVDVITYEQTGFNIPADKRPAIDLRAAPGSAIVPIPIPRPTVTPLAR